MYKVNTSNINKKSEFIKYLGDQVDFNDTDLPEPLSDALTIITYKASQFPEGVLVDDTVLLIEGTDIGESIKFHLDDLSKYAGRKALFKCLLGFYNGKKVEVYTGEVLGTITNVPKGDSFGFLPYLLPDGETLTLGECLPDRLNPRFFAIEKLKGKIPDSYEDPIFEWDGDYQV